MDARFQVTDARRDIPAGVSAGTPLVTLAWRALRVEQQRAALARQRQEAELRRVQDVWVSLAEETFRLRRLSQTTPHLSASAQRLEEALSQAGVHIVAPEGQPYTEELMELLDNVARRPDPQVSEPQVAEIITPAVLWRGMLLRLGQAVIAVPAAEAG